MHVSSRRDSSSMHFEDHLALHCLAMNTIEFVFGDGWKDQDHCGKCERGWFKSGWICPDRYEDLRWVFDWKESFHAIAADLLGYLGLPNGSTA